MWTAYLIEILQESLIRFVFFKVIQMLLSVGHDSFNVLLVLDGQIQGSIPSEQIDIHLDGPVYQGR